MRIPVDNIMVGGFHIPRFGSFGCAVIYDHIGLSVFIGQPLLIP